MANFAKIRITIISTPPVGEISTVIFDSFFMQERAQTVRQGTKQFTIGANNNETALNLASAFDADYSPTGLEASLPISVYGSISSDFVDIEAVEYGHEFAGTPPSWATYTITPEEQPQPSFVITDITVQAADAENRNTHARFNISISNGTPLYDITAPVSKLNQSEPLFIDFFRSFFKTPLPRGLSITDGNSDIATSTLPGVDYFTLDSVTVIESNNGATVTANTTTFLGDISTNKEYSLDNINWQSGASFNGILTGSYTMYVRDNLGALYSEVFNVVGVSPGKPEPYFEIVNSNPIRFVPDNTFDCNLIPNWSNALLTQILSEQFPNVEKRDYSQLISDCDTIDNQIRTNYDNITINVIDCTGETIATPTAEVKKINILKEDKRDCILKQVSSGENVGKTFLYFTGGNIYTPDTSDVIGTYTNPTGGIFPFAKNGSLFTISNTDTLNGYHNQLGVEFDVATGSYGVVLDVAFTGNDFQTAIVQTTYNEQVYNIWEFSLVGTYLPNNKTYKLEVVATDSDVRYQDIKWISEPIHKLSSTKGTVLFTSSNNLENTANIDFSTGIKLQLRIKGRFIVATTNEESDTFETQQGTKVVLKTTITRSIPFESGLVPYYIVEKLAIYSGLDNLLIQGVKFVSDEDIDNAARANERNPFYTIIRNYREDSSIDISDSIGLVTESPEVIGESDTIVIGT